jgi:hypothetical protein
MMKKIIYLLIALLTISTTFADYLLENPIRYCTEGRTPSEIKFVICKDKNNLFGCQTNDEFINPITIMTVENNCTKIDLNLPEGNYYYTVNSLVGGTTVSAESGEINYVPEFSIDAAGIALLACTYFIFIKRN